MNETDKRNLKDAISLRVRNLKDAIAYAGENHRFILSSAFALLFVI